MAKITLTGQAAVNTLCEIVATVTPVMLSGP